MKIIVILITPEMAAQLLESNTRNRRVKWHKVAEYAKMMTEGKWKPNTAEPIKISITGILLDGQNRLYAVIKSGIPIEFSVATGLQDDVFDVLDTGARRSAHDTFYTNGVKNASSISAGIRHYNALSSGIVSGRGGGVSKLISNTNNELLSAYEARSEFWQHAAKVCGKFYKSFNGIFAPGELVGMYAYLFDIAPKHAEQFLTELCIDGTTNVPAILYARKLLLANKINSGKVTERTKLAWVFNAWNVFRSGSKRKNIDYNAKVDAFPIPA